MSSHRQSFAPSITTIYHEKIIREYELQVKEYEDEKKTSNTIINQLQKKLSEKDKLLKCLLEEQDQNSDEFEKLCKENLTLKRTLAEIEARNIDLQNDIFNITATNHSLEEEQEQMSHLSKSMVAPLKQELNELTSENYYLQTKLKYVLNECEKIKEQNKANKIQSCQLQQGFKITKNKNTSSNLIKLKKKLRIIERRYRAISEKIKNLDDTNLSDAKSKKDTTEIISKLEPTKQNILNEIEKTVACGDFENIARVDKSVCYNEEIKTDNPKIYFFSDNIGRGLISLITPKLPKDYILFNCCKPDASIERITESLFKTENELSHQDTLVLLISNFYPSLINRYQQIVIKLLNKKGRQYKLIISGCLYNGHDDRRIYDMNEKICNLVAIKQNVRYFELNYDVANVMMKFKKVQKKVINHLAQLLVQFRSRSTSTFNENDYS